MRPGFQFVVAGFIAVISMQSHHISSGAQLDSGPLDSVSWHLDLNAAKEIALEENRPLLLHFWTPDCAPCKRLERNVFNRASVAETLHDFFIPVKINGNLHPAIAAKYKVDRFPTDIVVSPKDEELYRMISPQSPQQYVARLSAVAFRSGIVARNKKSNTRLGEYDLPGSSFHQSGSIDNASYARTEEPGPDPESLQHEARNPYADNASVSAGRYDGQNPYVNSLLSENSGQRATAAKIDDVRYGEDTYPPKSNDIGDEAPATNSAENLPLGMDGYCPVTLLKKDAWKKGDSNWGVVHRGRTYFFAGQAEKDLFLAKPDEYSPVLAGIDPVQLVSSGIVKEGDRAHGVVYQKRVYLFSSEENLETFWNAPERFTEPVQQAMFGHKTFR